MKIKNIDKNSYKNLFSMKNKTVAIFGGAGKLGVQFEKVLSFYGGQVYLLDKKINFKEKGINYLKCDVESKKSVESAFYKILKKEKKIDVIIYNVYSKPNNYYKNFEKYDLKTWKKVMDTNLTGAFLVSQLAINNFLKNKKKGNIIFLSSTYGIVGPNPNIYTGLKAKKNIYGGKFSLNTPAAYSSTKSGLIGLSKYIATNFGKHNIRSNILSPGGVYDNQEKKFVKNYKSKVPLNRMANWSDYDGAILFLSSDASNYMSGSNLVVDGGWTSW
jgi:NAD(P)-dependent dehydrogenase (short-subunit alcohol dehydrogenase family)